MKSFSSILLAALAALVTFAARADVEAPDFSTVKRLPLVEKPAAEDPAVPDEIQAAFDKAFREAGRLYGANRRAEAHAAFLALEKEYAGHPALLRRARAEHANQLSRGKSGEEAAATVELADALLAEAGRPTAEASRWIAAKAGALERAGRLEEAVGANYRLLAQPDQNSNAVAAAGMRIVRLLDQLNRPADAARLAAAALADAALSPNARADFALYAANLRRSKLDDFAGAEAALRSALALPLGCDGPYAMRPRVANTLAGLFSQKRPEPDLATANEVHKTLVEDQGCPMDTRVAQLRSLLSNASRMKEDDGRLAALRYGDAFVATNAATMSPKNLAVVRDSLFGLAKSRKTPDVQDCLARAAALMEDVHADLGARYAATEYTANHHFNSGRIEESVHLFRQMLPVFDKNADLTLKALSGIARASFVKGREEEGIAILEELCRLFPTADGTNKMVAAIAGHFKDNYEPEKALAVYEKYGRRWEIAKLCTSSMLRDDARATPIFHETLLNPKSSVWAKRDAWSHLFTKDPAAVEQSFDSLFSDGRTNDIVRMLANKIADPTGYAYVADYADVIRAYTFLRRIAGGKGQPAIEFKVWQYAANAYAGLGRRTDAMLVCRDALASGAKFSAAETYQLRATIALLGLKGDEKALAAAIPAAERPIAKEAAVTAKERAARLRRVGATALTAGDEALVRALDGYVKSLYVPAAKKRYVVHYSDQAVNGYAAWQALARKPERQLMDRAYGGNTDFFVTDVGTGDRGSGETAGKALAEKAALGVVCDLWGLHFLFEMPDEKARDIEAGLLSGGSYEAYLAPGENQPYVCVLMDINSEGMPRFYNTTYETALHRRAGDPKSGLSRGETIYADDRVYSYFAISWDVYGSLVPANGDVWEFENFLWGRAGSAAWNGSESIHGRSTWGELVFDMPEKARVAILRRQLFRAMASYKREKVTNARGEGVIDHWRDPAIGDPEFYRECVAPVVAELDQYLPRVKSDMTDAEVIAVADAALVGWRDIRYTIARLREQYLAKKLAGE